MAIPEKHRAVAHEFVDGAQIQWQKGGGAWVDCTGTPAWLEECEYRVKPGPLRLPTDTVDSIASYYCLMPATVEAVSARVLRDAAALQLVVPMAEVQEVARQLAEKDRSALDDWIKRTDWVQEQNDSFGFMTLGMHRADVMKKAIEHLRTKRDKRDLAVAQAVCTTIRNCWALDAYKACQAYIDSLDLPAIIATVKD
jgi:hypothetical protein